MSSKYEESAFPTQTAEEYIHGMSLRDYFAGQALIGITLKDRVKPWPSDKELTDSAYELADSMLKSRQG